MFACHCVPNMYSTCYDLCVHVIGSYLHQYIDSQVVEHLEADLGVKVQQLQIPQLKYSFQIWGAMMASPGKDGKVSVATIRCICIETCPNILYHRNYTYNSFAMYSISVKLKGFKTLIFNGQLFMGLKPVVYPKMFNVNIQRVTRAFKKLVSLRDCGEGGCM